MVVTGLDNRNIIVAMDLVQAKLLVETLRLVSSEVMVQASEVVQESGFKTMAYDTYGAIQSLCSVVGFVTDKMKLEVEVQKEQEQSNSKPETNEEDKDEGKEESPEEKVWIN